MTWTPKPAAPEVKPKPAAPSSSGWLDRIGQTVSSWWSGMFPNRTVESGPVTNVPATKPSEVKLSLGPNERYRDAILLASKRTAVDPPALAALIGAEAGYYDKATVTRMTDEAFHARHPELKGRSLTSSDKELAKEWKALQQQFAGTWNPDSVGPAPTKATGLTQFIVGTWTDEAKRSGTYLNEKAKEKGYVGQDNRLVAEKEAELLALRRDPTLSIVAAAEYGQFNLGQLAMRGVDLSKLSDTEKAKLMYLAHHEGWSGAIQVREGTLSNSRARYLLSQNVTDAKARQALIDEHGSEAKAYIAWITAYTDKQIQPDRYR